MIVGPCSAGNTMLPVQKGVSCMLSCIKTSFMQPSSDCRQAYMDSRICTNLWCRECTISSITMALQRSGISRMEWPPRSPDCSPIKLVWDHLQRQLHNRQHQPQNLEEFAEALREEWQDMDQEFLRALILIMPRRVQAVLRARRTYQVLIRWL